jgi:hypothetical protein
MNLIVIDVDKRNRVALVHNQSLQKCQNGFREIKRAPPTDNNNNYFLINTYRNTMFDPAFECFSQIRSTKKVYLWQLVDSHCDGHNRRYNQKNEIFKRHYRLKTTTFIENQDKKLVKMV